MAVGLRSVLLAVCAVFAALLCCSLTRAELTVLSGGDTAGLDPTVVYDMRNIYGNIDVPHYSYVGPLVHLRFSPDLNNGVTKGKQCGYSTTPDLNKISSTQIAQRIVNSTGGSAESFAVTPSLVFVVNIAEILINGCENSDTIGARLREISQDIVRGVGGSASSGADQETRRLSWAVKAAHLVLFVNPYPNSVEYGGPEDGRLPLYWRNLPPNLYAATVSNLTGETLINAIQKAGSTSAVDSTSYLLVRASENPGPWNRFLMSPVYIVIRAAYYLSLVPLFIFTGYQLFLHIFHFGFVVNLRSMLLLFTVIAVSSAIALAIRDPASKGLQAFWYIGLMFGSIGYCLFLLRWAHFMKLIHDSYLILGVVYNAYLATGVYAVALIICTVMALVENSTIEKVNDIILGRIAPVVMGIQAILFIAAGITYMFVLAKLPSSPGINILRRLTHLCWVMFVSWLACSITMAVFNTRVGTTVTGHIVCRFVFLVAIFTLYSSVVWVLQIQRGIGLAEKQQPQQDIPSFVNTNNQSQHRDNGPYQQQHQQQQQQQNQHHQQHPHAQYQTGRNPGGYGGSGSGGGGVSDGPLDEKGVAGHSHSTEFGQLNNRVPHSDRNLGNVTGGSGGGNGFLYSTLPDDNIGSPLHQAHQPLRGDTGMIGTMPGSSAGNSTGLRFNQAGGQQAQHQRKYSTQHGSASAAAAAAASADLTRRRPLLHPDNQLGATDFDGAGSHADNPLASYEYSGFGGVTGSGGHQSTTAGGNGGDTGLSRRYSFTR
ncbi:hypothetical protein GQ42DRAFT_160254 [Ramicandelaber brevisporus]|nr:hypothetical protein GQ42DRAFT_160254 [Ramicandelaber brevisporus]